MMEFASEGICERCGCSAFLNTFFDKSFSLCMKCSMEWIFLANKKHRAKEITNQEEGKEALRKFIKELWSVS